MRMGAAARDGDPVACDMVASQRTAGNVDRGIAGEVRGEASDSYSNPWRAAVLPM